MILCQLIIIFKKTLFFSEFMLYNSKKYKKENFMKKFFNEFKEFAIKGNMFDLAVGLMIGTAFNAVINSLIKDIFMPFIGILMGGKD